MRGGKSAIVHMRSVPYLPGMGPTSLLRFSLGILTMWPRSSDIGQHFLDKKAELYTSLSPSPRFSEQMVCKVFKAHNVPFFITETRQTRNLPTIKPLDLQNKAFLTIRNLHHRTQGRADVCCMSFQQTTYSIFLCRAEWGNIHSGCKCFLKIKLMRWYAGKGPCQQVQSCIIPACHESMQRRA